MNTFSLGNLHFLDDIDKFLDNEKNTSTSASQVNQINQTKSEHEDDLSDISTKSNEIKKPNFSTTTNLQTNNDHLNNSTSSSSVEFDENLNVLNDLDEANSLHTVDYSENQIDPNLPYQSVFTLNTLDRTDNEQKFENKTSDEKSDFEFDLGETTFKARPYRPQSAIKRKTISFGEKDNQKKLAPITINKGPSLLSHSFWTDIEKEVQRDNDEQMNDSDLENGIKSEKDIKINYLNDDDSNNKKTSIDENSSDEIQDDDDDFEKKDEKIQSLSSEEDENELIQIDEENGSKSSSLNESLNLNKSTESTKVMFESTKVMFDELKTFISRSLNSDQINQKSRDDKQIIDELNELKQLITKSTLDNEFKKFKNQLLHEVSEMLNKSLKNELEKERNKFEFDELKLQIENLEHKLITFNESINKLSRQDSRSNLNDLEINKLMTLIKNMDQQYRSSINDVNRLNNRLTDDLILKLEKKFNLNDELLNLIQNLDTKFDLILQNKQINDKKLVESIFSSDEDTSLDEIKKATNEPKQLINTKEVNDQMNNKLDEIKSIIIEMQNQQKSKDESIVKENLIQLNDRIGIEETNKQDLKEKQAISEDLKSNTCDLCELANNIRSNIVTFRSIFYRQKMRIYSKCSYTDDFLNKFDQQFKFGKLDTKHDHKLTDFTIDLDNEYDHGLNLRLKNHIQETTRTIRNDMNQLKQLGNYNFKINETESNLNDKDDNHRLKQIQMLRFNLNRRLDKLNQII